MAQASHVRYRAVIAGLGFIGAGDQVSGDALGQQVSQLDGTHAGALSGNARVALVAGSSRDAGRRERFAERYAREKVRTYADWREMLTREKPEIVSVATYSPEHAPIVIAAAELGARAIYCEKPIAQCVEDAQRMVDACARAGALLVINHNRRFNPNYRKLRDFVASGALGTLTSANLQWSSGRLGNVGTHFIDALMMLTGRQVTAVMGTLDSAGKPDCRGTQFHDPGGWGLLRLEGGLIATLDAADYGRVPASLRLNGTLGRATTAGDDVNIELTDGRKEHWPSMREEANSMSRAVAEIVAWLDDRSAPFPYDAAGAVRTLEAIAGLHLSHERGAWVTLPLAGEDRRRVVNSG